MATITAEHTALRFTVTPLYAALGADVYGFPFADATDAEFDTMRAAWVRHQVLRFRNVDIDDAIQVAFSKRLGPPVIHPRQLQQGAHGGFRELLVISNARKADGSAAGDLGDGEVRWHTDTWFVERPPSASILRSIRLPPSGGDTHFLDMYAAFESAPEALKHAATGRLVHHQTVYDDRGEIRLGMTKPDSDDSRTWPGVRHPLVRMHGESGRRCFFLGGATHAWIVGLPRDESDALIEELWRHCVQDRFVWTQVWRAGDMVMWDNRCVMHRRDSFDPALTRLMHRTTVRGERPV